MPCENTKPQATVSLFIAFSQARNRTGDEEIIQTPNRGKLSSSIKRINNQSMKSPLLKEGRLTAVRYSESSTKLSDSWLERYQQFWAISTMTILKLRWSTAPICVFSKSSTTVATKTPRSSQNTTTSRDTVFTESVLSNVQMLMLIAYLSVPKRRAGVWHGTLNARSAGTI